MKYFKYTLFLFCAIISFHVWSQPQLPLIRAEITPDTVMIGDRFQINMEIEKDILQIVEFPYFDDMQEESLEYIGESMADTIPLGDRRVLLKKSFTMTIYDEGWYSLGNLPVLFLDKNITDTLYTTDSLHVFVDTYIIDLDNQEINGIKPPRKAPLVFSEFAGYLIMGILIVQIVAVLLYILRQIVGKEKDKPKEVLKPAMPAHILAIRELEKLNEEKLWQNNRHKLYYIRLTDIIREYIENRYGINAMEMTSVEITDSLDDFQLAERTSLQLRRLLSTADYVKFAKYLPSVEDNEMSYNDAYYFVEDTKLSPLNTGKNEKD